MELLKKFSQEKDKEGRKQEYLARSQGINEDLGNFPNSYRYLRGVFFKDLEISQMPGYLRNFPYTQAFGKFTRYQAIGKFPRYPSIWKISQKSRHWGNFPDTLAFGKFPKYPGIWEIFQNSKGI